jgi:methyl-accepting chemotaxis protein
MVFLKNLRIQTLLITAIAATLLVIGLFVATSWAVLLGVNERVSEQDSAVTAMVSIEEVRYHLAQVQQHLNDVPATGSAEGLAHAKTHALAAVANLETLEKTGAASEKEIAPFKQSVSELYRTGAHMAEVYLKSGREAGNALMHAPVTGFDARVATLTQALDKVLGGLNTRLNDASQAVRDSETRARYLIVGFAGVIAVFAAAVLGTLYLKCLPPLQSLRDSLTDLNRGEADLTRRLPESGNDEVGIIVKEFNAFVEMLEPLLREVISASHRTKAAVDQVALVTAQTREGVFKQQTETDQVATAINEMTATVQEVARNAANAASAATQADSETTRGRGVVDQTVSSIAVLADDVERAAGVIQQVGNDSANIQKVIEVISAIAEQTNLLALNAAIEAARAGEQGRGFAVVADEVRTLATRTQAATGEIHQIIERLRSGATEAVKAMEQGRTQARSSVEQATQAGQALRAIAEAVATINDMNAQIASAAEEQSSVAAEINRNIVNISQVADETTLRAQQTSKQTGELSHTTAELQTLVGRFKVRG